MRVLLLEDDPADAELALAALAAAGFACEAEVAGGRADFERLHAAGGWDLVLADYSLPGYTGLDALARVRAADPLLPFILVSGALGEERAVDALRAGANDFVLKGNLRRLAPAVLRALDEARERREHRAVQQALELSERRYRAVVEDQSELIIRMLPDSTVTFVNRAYCRYYGLQPDQLLGRAVLHSLSPENRAALQRSLAGLSAQSPTYERDALVRDAAGEERWTHWVARGIFDARGTLAEVQSVGRDVTELRRLSRRLLEVQETERRNLARDLHDDIGQALTALKLNLEAVARARDGGALQARLDEALDTTRHALARVRALSLNLRPLQLDDLGLVAALRSHLDRQAALARIAPHLELGEPPAALGLEIESACFRVAQEAINNVVRHAAAGNLWLGLSFGDGRMALTVRDDGRGFDVRAAQRRAAAGESLGVVSMQERVALAGGSFDIRSTPGEGTVVSASFPLEAP
ncbi:MAG TPA: PAS domain S-box protein [Burkholderiales bacterium]|nr:PAS domain S-box protein [Burkholderiales bacterium]